MQSLRQKKLRIVTKMSSYRCVLIALLMAHSCCQVEAQNDSSLIIEQPKSQNKSVNDVVTFRCSAASADVFTWFLRDPQNYSMDVRFINEIADQRDTHTVFEDDLTVSTLELELDKEFGILNRSHVHCRAIFFESNVHHVNSKEAELIIQGILAPPVDFQTKGYCKESQGYVQATWNPPYTIDGVSIDFYVIMVGNDPDKVNSSSVPIPVSKSKYTSCQDLEVCVAAVTLAGESNFTCSAINLAEGMEEISLADIQSKVVFDPDEERFNVIFKILGDAGCWIAATSSNLSAIVTNQEHTEMLNNVHYTYDYVTKAVSMTLSVGFQETVISTNIIKTNCDIEHCSCSVNNSLFHISNVTFDGTMVTCYFIDQSTAMGCHLNFACSMNPSEVMTSDNMCQFSIEKDDSNANTASLILPDFCQKDCSGFVLEAYDIYNGSIGPVPAKTITKIINVMPPFPTEPSTEPSPSINPTSDADGFYMLTQDSVLFSSLLFCHLCQLWI